MSAENVGPCVMMSTLSAVGKCHASSSLFNFILLPKTLIKCTYSYVIHFNRQTLNFMNAIEAFYFYANELNWIMFNLSLSEQ